MPKRLLQYIGLGLGILLILYLFAGKGMFLGIQKSLQNRFYDFASASPEIVVVAIDEKTLLPENLGPLQKWPRATYAKALDFLREKKVAAVGIDVTFPDASTHGTADDAVFRDALKKTPNAVLAGRYFFENGESVAEWPNPTILEAEPTVGWINVSLDEDGFVRKIPLFNTVGEKSTEAFSLAVTRKALQADPVAQTVSKGVYPYSKDLSIPAITLRDSTTQKDTHLMYVNYFAEPGGYSTLSLSDLLAGRLIDKRGRTLDLTDKIVLIGPTAIDLQDQYLSPVSHGVKMPGVEIHANNIQTILTGKFLRDQSEQSLWITLLLIVALNLFLFSRLRVRFAIPFAVLELLGVVVAGIAGYEYRIFLNVVYPFLAVLLSFVGAFLVRFILEQSERQFVEKAFGRYVSRAVVDQILKHPGMLKLGGERRDITVFFSDIAGFTSISEKMQPEELVGFLNTYLAAMTQVILGHQGTLDKYEGDAIMAFWGAPLPMADHAKQACLAALENQKKLESLREEWKKKGLPPLHVRIGLNTGDAIVGNMGSETRFDYTVMGDNVNLASRLEGIGKQYGTQIIISESTHEKVKDDFVCRELDLIRVKGKERPVRIFELMGLKDQVSEVTLKHLGVFQKGLELYRARNFLAATSQFRELLEDPPAQAFLQRCERFIQNPPPAEWDGVYTFTEK